MVDQSLIESLKECEAIKFGRFVLTSGVVSNYYIDIKRASTQPQILKKFALGMAAKLKDFDIIAGMELGAVPIAAALSLETNKPYVIIRKEKREHGTGKQIEGGDVENKKVIIVEDVTTSGGSVVKLINILRENKAKVIKVITVVDRESDAKDKILALNVEFDSLLTVSEILKT